MQLDTLKAKLTASNTLANSLTWTADKADEVAESLGESAVSGAQLAGSLDTVEDQTDAASRALSGANAELAEGAAEGAIYAEGMGEVAQKQAEAAAASALTADQIDEVGGEAVQSASQVGTLDAALAGASAQSLDFSRLLGEVNSELGEGAAQSAVYAEGMDEVAQEQAEAAAAAALLDDRVESVGDEMLQSAAFAELFGESLDDIDDSGLRATLGGISGSITKVAAVAAAASVPLAGLAAGLGSVAAFGGIGGLAAGALTAGGIQGMAEDTARLSSNLEDAAEAREQMMAGFKSDIADAFEPIQGQQAQQFAMENMEAVVDIAEDAGASLAGVQGTVYGVAGGLREATTATSPEVFAELATQTERLAPMFTQLEGAVRAVPGLIQATGNVAARLGPDLFTLGAASLDVAGGFISLGVAAGDTLLPFLSAVLFLTGGILSTFQALPAPLQNAAVAFTVAAGGAYLLSGGLGVLSGSMFATTLATQGLIAALGTLTLPISGTAAAIAALIGVGVGLAAHFGVLDDAAGLLAVTWNFLLEGLELGINLFLGAANAIGNFLGPLSLLIPGIGAVIFVISHWNEIMGVAKGLIGSVGDAIEWLAKQADKYLGPVLDMLGGVADGIDQAGGVQLDAAKAGTGGGSDGDDESDGGDSGPSPPGGGSPPPSAPAAQTRRRGPGPTGQSGASGSSGGETTVDNSTQNYDVTVEAAEDPDTTAERVVERLREERKRQDG